MPGTGNCSKLNAGEDLIATNLARGIRARNDMLHCSVTPSWEEHIGINAPDVAWLRRQGALQSCHWRTYEYIHPTFSKNLAIYLTILLLILCFCRAPISNGDQLPLIDTLDGRGIYWHEASDILGNRGANNCSIVLNPECDFFTIIVNAKHSFDDNSKSVMSGIGI